MIWALRGLILLVGVAAPVIGFWIRAATLATGNAEQAIDGLAWGLVGSAVLAQVFGATLRGSLFEFWKAQGVYVLVIVISWTAILSFSNSGR